jgi:hypothetical protein
MASRLDLKPIPSCEECFAFSAVSGDRFYRSASVRSTNGSRMAVCCAAICMKRSKADRLANMPVSPRYLFAAFSHACSGRCCGVCVDAICLRQRWRVSACVGEVSRLSLNASRRLQLCAGGSGVTALIIRRWHNAAEKNATVSRTLRQPVGVCRPPSRRQMALTVCRGSIGNWNYCGRMEANRIRGLWGR